MTSAGQFFRLGIKSQDSIFQYFNKWRNWHTAACLETGMQCHTPGPTLRHGQGHSDRGRGVYRYIYPPNQSTLNFLWLFCLLHPGQIRYRAIYTHPNQIPGYASGHGLHAWTTPGVHQMPSTGRSDSELSFLLSVPPNSFTPILFSNSSLAYKQWMA